MIDIPGYEGRYAITETGEVWSYHINRFLKHKIGKIGYHRVTLMFERKQKIYLIHRLVNAAYNDNPDNKPHTNHIDGNKSNNHYTNLEWVTRSENMLHAFKTGLIGYVNSNKNGSLSGEGNGRAKLTESVVTQIRHESLSRKFGDKPWIKYRISRGQYDQIVSGRSWKHCIGNFVSVRVKREAGL